MQNWAPRPFKCPFPCKRLTISTASRLSVRDELGRRIVTTSSNIGTFGGSLSVAPHTPEAEGIQASHDGRRGRGFVGGSVSEPLLQGGILCLVLAYMIHVDLWVAGTAIALFVTQLVFVPLMKGAMNRRTRARVWIIRHPSVSVVEGISSDKARDRADEVTCVG
jgi:hypothetical protein